MSAARRAELQIVRASTLPFELLRVEVLEALVRVHILWAFVISNPDDPSKPKSKSARVVRAPLDFVVRDLDDGLRTDMESPSLLGRREATQPLRHRLEFLVREPLDRLPDHLERTTLAVAHREPVVRQPALSAATPPLRRGNREVQVVRGLDLEPLLPLFSDGVRGLQLLRHEAFVPGDERLLEECLDLLPVLRDAPGGQQVRRHEPLEDLPAHAIRLVDPRSSVEGGDIEQVQLQRNLLLGRFDAVDASEATHEILKRGGLCGSVPWADPALAPGTARGQSLP